MSGRLSNAWLRYAAWQFAAFARTGVFDASGFTSEMKRVADGFASEGYAVFMSDLFSRGGWFACIRSLLRDVERGEGQGVDDLVAAQNWLATREYADAEHVGVIGFCLGGGFALLLARKGLFRVAAPFYGKSPDRLDGACPIVASYGGCDKIMQPEVAKVQAETTRLNIPADIKIYPEAGHSFMSKAPNPVLGLLGKILPVHAAYDPVAAADAKQRVLSFLRTHL